MKFNKLLAPAVATVAPAFGAHAAQAAPLDHSRKAGKVRVALKEWIDGWVSTHLRNGRLDAIYKKYHGPDLPANVVTPA